MSTKKGALTCDLVGRRVRPLSREPLLQPTTWTYANAPTGKPAKSAEIVAAWVEEGRVVVAARGPADDVREHLLTYVLLSDKNGEFVADECSL